VQGLQSRGWADGSNLRVEYRWAAGDVEIIRKDAAELIAMGPDVILAGGPVAVMELQRATKTIPILFAGVADPVGHGFVASLARPGGNTTGFMGFEFAYSAKWLELLKQMAPMVKKVGVVRTAAEGDTLGLFAGIQTAAASLGVELTAIGRDRDPTDAERDIVTFASQANAAGLIVIGGGAQKAMRDSIIALAARYRLPTIYPFRRFVVEGGLISFGPDLADPYRQVASYADRILKGEKPADLPVQAPTKFEMVLNLKTANSLGIQVPDIVRLRAEEVIE
jgi:putative ABC transport system substrate-binding protein